MKQPDQTEIGARAYYDRIAPDYDVMLETAGNRAIRACFWRHVETLVPEPSRILDFGAGSGIDAAYFAGLGHHVTAYDLSEGMLAILHRRCAAQIAAGSIAPIAGTLEDIRSDLAARAPFDAIVSNFAVFSTIAEIGPVLRLFGEMVRPGGIVLISIQNPWRVGDMRTRRFWRALLLLAFTRTLRFRGADLAQTFHHMPGQIRRAARADFVPEPSPRPACARSCFGPTGTFRLVALRRR